MDGSTVWFFPDGDLPPRGEQEPHGHESLIVLNPNACDAAVTITVYFETDPPVVLQPQTVEAERVRCFRLDRPIAGFSIPYGQYALKVASDTPVVCQIGRMDVRQANLAYYTVMGHPG